MKLDALVTLIESADPSSFREIALHALRARGYEPALADGPYDGGHDLLPYVRGLDRMRLAVQVSTEDDWEKKLRRELAHPRWKQYVKDGLRVLHFVSSRRIPEASFRAFADEVERSLGLTVERFDAQGIASVAVAQRIVPEIFAALGISLAPTAPRGDFHRNDHRLTLAFAYAFFADASDDFRRGVVERALVNELALAGASAPRDQVLTRAAQTLGVDAAQRPLLQGALDRLLQRAELRATNGTLNLPADEHARWQAARALQGRAASDLLAAIEGALAGHVPAAAQRRDVAMAVMENLGALLVESSATTCQRAVFVESGDAPRERVRRLAATLAAAGIPDGAARDDVLPAIVALAQGSSFGRSLMTGELFLSLTTLGAPYLLRALAEGRGFEVLLDTPVAMPLLCARLYEPTHQGFFLAADAVWKLLRAHDLPVKLPRDYLEEIASHLIDAARDYAALVDPAPDLDLVGSENAFVAHYVALHRAGRAPAAEGERSSFEVYLEGFELTPKMLRAMDFYALRDAVMARIQRAFAGYGVEVVELSASPRALRGAQESLAWALRELGVAREGVVLDHDARTLAWARERQADPRVSRALCTWDRLHLHLRASGAHGFDVFDPPTLTDLLALAAPPSDEARATSPLVVAQLVSEEQARQGAAVWDALAAHERRNLQDARLRSEARRFKDAWVERSREVLRERGLLDAWADWKARHLPGGGS